VKRWILGMGIAASLVVPRAAGGEVAYEAPPPPPPSSPPSSFCAGGLPRESLTPFRPRPRLNAPPASGSVEFGPSNLVLERLPSRIEGKGMVGYKLTGRSSTAAIHLNWDITTTFSLIDWRGRLLEKVRRTQRHLEVIPGRGASFRFAVDGDPAFYRVTSVFRNEAGRKLGGYGFYFRVVPETEGARLVLKANAYREMLSSAGWTTWERTPSSTACLSRSNDRKARGGCWPPRARMGLGSCRSTTRRPARRGNVARDLRSPPRCRPGAIACRRGSPSDASPL
jgi:hypothetical protein